MVEPTITVSRHGSAVAVVTLNRPAQRNALTLAMWRELAALVEDLGGDTALRAIVLTGAGGVFSAGADIKEFSEVRASAEGAAVYAEAVERCNAAFAHSPKATFAAVTGTAFGGACGLALACDFRVADATAAFAIPAARLSIVYGIAETRALLAAVGLAHAKEMLFTARTYGAEEAAAIGLVSRLVETDALGAAIGWAEGLADRAPLSIAGAKAVLALLTEGDTAERRAAVERAARRAVTSADYQEAVRAFAEKRPSRFTGA